MLFYDTEDMYAGMERFSAMQRKKVDVYPNSLHEPAAAGVSLQKLTVKSFLLFAAGRRV